MTVWITIICIILLAVGFTGGYLLNAVFTQNKLSDAYSEMYLREQSYLKRIEELEEQAADLRDTLQKVMRHGN